MSCAIPAPMERYRHFKGGLYQVLAVARDAGTGEDVVVYQGLYPPYQLWTRPLKEFTEVLDPRRYPEAGQRRRFERCDGESEGAPEAFSVTEGGNTAGGEERTASLSEPRRTSLSEPRRTSLSEPRPANLPEAGPETRAETLPERIDPRVEAFLDAETIEDKLSVLSSLRSGVTNGMIDTMAISAGVEIGPGEVSGRLLDLKECLMTKARYEQRRGSRL